MHKRLTPARVPADDHKMSTFITTWVNFGNKPAGCVAQSALRETAQLYEHMSPEASSRIINDTYCDDVVTGGNSIEQVSKIAQDMKNLVRMGGFEFKGEVVSGQKLDDKGRMKVLGTFWDVEKDRLAIDIHVNYADKIKGLRVGQDMELEEVLARKTVLTKRLV